jgi:hypothetical protein
MGEVSRQGKAFSSLPETCHHVRRTIGHPVTDLVNVACHLCIEIEPPSCTGPYPAPSEHRERSWRQVFERTRFRIVHYSVQGNHVHLLVEAASARDLACGLKSVRAGS